MAKKWIYIGAFLDDFVKSNLLNKYKEYIPEGWTLYGDHTTFAFNDGSPFAEAVFNHYKDAVGVKINLVSVGLGISDRAVALELSQVGFECTNKIMHITLAVAPGAKPVESNNINEWEPLAVNDMIPSQIGVFANGQKIFEKQW